MANQQPEGMPKTVNLMFQTLEALKQLGGSGHVSEIDDAIAENLALSDDVLEYRAHKAETLLFNWKCAWARTHLKSANAIENTARGVWAIKPDGRSLTPDRMSDVLSESRRAARQKRSERPDTGVESSEDEDAATEWEEALLSVLRSMGPDAFERLAKRILRESNFSKVEVTGRSGDGGIDGIGVLNIELISFQVIFQCKRYKETISAGAIRDFRGAMVGRTDKGLFITTGRFTPDARREATRDGAPPIDLIDGYELCGILKKLKLGVNTQMIEQVHIRSEFFDSI